MDVPLEFNDVAAALPLRDGRPICPWCDRGTLDLIKLWLDPKVGITGVTLKCSAPECGKLTDV
jgi:hypothetical protein